MKTSKFSPLEINPLYGTLEYYNITVSVTTYKILHIHTVCLFTAVYSNVRNCITNVVTDIIITNVVIVVVQDESITQCIANLKTMAH